jgi:hypothetical protein
VERLEAPAARCPREAEGGFVRRESSVDFLRARSLQTSSWEGVGAAGSPRGPPSTMWPRADLVCAAGLSDEGASPRGG